MKYSSLDFSIVNEILGAARLDFDLFPTDLAFSDQIEGPGLGDPGTISTWKETIHGVDRHGIPIHLIRNTFLAGGGCARVLLVNMQASRMTGQDSQSIPVLAFLTVCEGEDGNYFGGLLAVNPSGRPLEFHCTAPVRANRAQQILFGSTLPAFVYGEQISKVLLSGMELVPAVVCTDKAPVLAVQPDVAEPVVLVERIEEGKEVTLARDTAGEVTVGLSWEMGSYRLTIDHRREQQRAEIEKLVELFDETVELDEPFERIREAIQEAQQSARAA